MHDYNRLMNLVSNNPNDNDAFIALAELQEARNKRVEDGLPFVGMGVTCSTSRDCFPGTIVNIRLDGIALDVRRDVSHTKVIDGKRYTVFFPGSGNNITTYTHRPNLPTPRWIRQGSNNDQLHLGVQDRYLDPFN